MQEWVALLRNFQEVELIVDRLENLREELLRTIASREARLAEEEARLQELQRRSKDLEIERRRKEGELKYDEDVIRKWEARLKDIEHHREYQVLIREIALAKKDNTAKEDEILKCLEEEDKIKKELRETEASYAQTQSAFSMEKSEALERVQVIERDLNEKHIRLKDLRDRCGGDLVEKYERIRKRRNGPALVEARDGVCQGCHMNIPPQVLNEVRRNTEMISCPNCQRILFWTVPETRSHAGH